MCDVYDDEDQGVTECSGCGSEIENPGLFGDDLCDACASHKEDELSDSLVGRSGIY